MKNYPNQASSFGRIRGTLAVIAELNLSGADTSDDGVLGYAAAEYRVYTFRNVDYGAVTAAQLRSRIAEELTKPAGSQGARTFARELRRTLRNMGWLDDQTQLTDKGIALLETEIYSVEEQALLVEGLLNIEATDGDGNVHHPIEIMLRLLARGPSFHRHGLELALEPRDDSQQELARVLKLYDLTPEARAAQLGVSKYQIANAIKIFPTLAVAAGLVVEEDGLYSLSQDGWRILGETPSQARATISKRRGRRTTVGKVVTVDTVAQRRNKKPPRMLTQDEQRRAAERLAERSGSHQDLVKRITAVIGDGNGIFMEDEFSYDLIWAPTADTEPVTLFEMKSITGATDAYARVRDAMGQLTYYRYFYVEPTFPSREVRIIAAFDQEIPQELVEFLSHENVGVIVAKPNGEFIAPNPGGQTEIARFAGPLSGSEPNRHTLA